jgi:hypothetical protein
MNGTRATWDLARKLFASRQYPELLGYFGDVLFPSQILGQAIELIDAGLLFAPDAAPATKFKAISSMVRGSFSAYPKEQGRHFSIVYCTREGAGMDCVFHTVALAWTPGTGWSEAWIDIPHVSGIIKAFASGERAVQKWNSRWLKTSEGSTSRAVFGAFCDSLFSGDDSFTGGAPQLIGLYRKAAAQTVGVIYRGRRYLYGSPVGDELRIENGGVAWRNELFEICDGRSMQRAPKAQVHRQPRGLGRARASDNKNNP